MNADVVVLVVQDVLAFGFQLLADLQDLHIWSIVNLARKSGPKECVILDAIRLEVTSTEIGAIHIGVLRESGKLRVRQRCCPVGNDLISLEQEEMAQNFEADFWLNCD